MGIVEQTIEVEGQTLEAVAHPNYCGGVWTAILRAGDTVLESGTGYSAEAIRVATERLTARSQRLSRS